MRRLLACCILFLSLVLVVDCEGQGKGKGKGGGGGGSGGGSGGSGGDLKGKKGGGSDVTRGEIGVVEGILAHMGPNHIIVLVPDTGGNEKVGDKGGKGDKEEA